jgi:hypothetical protein
MEAVQVVLYVKKYSMGKEGTPPAPLMPVAFKQLGGYPPFPQTTSSTVRLGLWWKSGESSQQCPRRSLSPPPIIKHKPHRRSTTDHSIAAVTKYEQEGNDHCHGHLTHGHRTHGHLTHGRLIHSHGECITISSTTKRGTGRLLHLFG